MEPNKQGNEVDKFFEALPKEEKQKAEIFDDKKETQPVIPAKEDGDVDPEDVDDSIKNRRHRRLEQRLQAERETNIELNAIIMARADAEREGRESKGTDGKIDPRLLQIFGTNEPSKEAARLFQEMFAETAKQAREQARLETLQEIEQQQIGQEREQSKYESYIDEQLESIEDRYNIDITSDSAKASKARREFLELVEELSPKDDSGTITDYADFASTFDVYQKTHPAEKADNSRQREVASRSMTRSSGAGAPKAPTPGFRGWEKDYGI